MLQTKNKAVEQQLIHARTGMLIDFPFFGQLALRLKLVEDEGIPTLAVDGKNIFYNPTFVAGLSLQLTQSAMVHEVGHCIFEHISRRGPRNPKKWNYAGDYVINAMIKDSYMPIGDSWLFDPKFAGMSADEVYALLPDDLDGLGGMPLDEMVDGDPTESETIAIDWEIATVQAAADAKAIGKLPGSMERFLENMRQPEIDWRARLRRFVTEINRDDYSWSRMNRRMASYGFFLPGLWSENMGEVVVAIDTSGSIDQATLNAFGSEVKAIVDTVRPIKTTVIYCDATVNHVDEFLPNDQLYFKMHGGGGTDFRPPFKYMENKSIKPAAFVYLTDMFGPFPSQPPDFPVMWVATSGVVGPFGETVPISLND